MFFLTPPQLRFFFSFFPSENLQDRLARARLARLLFLGSRLCCRALSIRTYLFRTAPAIAVIGVTSYGYDYSIYCLSQHTL